MGCVVTSTAADGLRGADAQVRALFAAVAADHDYDSCAAHEITTRLLLRHERAAGSEHAEAWRSFLDVVGSLTVRPSWAATVATAANLTALFTLDDPEDYVDLAALVTQCGHGFVSSTQDRIGRRIEQDPSLPLTTALMWQLSPTRLADRLRDHTESPDEVVAACEQAWLWLFLADMDDAPPAQPITTLEEYRRVFEEETVVEWRRHFTRTVLDNPWSAVAEDVVATADRMGWHGQAASRFLALYRRRFEDREREVVAREIKRMVRQSGVSQREFAQLIGTSASRLSTYVTGSTTPSAAMLLRISRVAKSLAERRGSSG